MATQRRGLLESTEVNHLHSFTVLAPGVLEGANTEGGLLRTCQPPQEGSVRDRPVRSGVRNRHSGKYTCDEDGLKTRLRNGRASKHANTPALKPRQ